jgi:hypothetical protein
MRNRNKRCLVFIRFVCNRVKVKHFVGCVIFLFFFLPSRPPTSPTIYCVQCDIPDTLHIGKHENTWKRLRHDNADIAVVLHSDAILSPLFWTELPTVIASAPSNWEYLQLTTSNTLIQRHMEHIDAPWILWMPEHTSMSAYVVNRQGLHKLLKSEPVHKYTSTNVIVKTRWEVEFRMKRVKALTKSILMISTTMIRTVEEVKREHDYWLADKEAIGTNVYKLIVVVSTQQLYDLVTQQIWDKNVQFVINPRQFNKYLYIRNFLDIMDKFDCVLLKDSDIRIPPLHKMLSDNSVIKGPLRQKWDGRIDERQWFKFQDAKLWKSERRTGFENVLSTEVAMLEQFFVIMDGVFAQWFFKQILTDTTLFRHQKPVQTDWGPDILWCKAAKQWDPTRNSCAIIPVVSQHDDTRQVVLWSSSTNHTNLNRLQIIRYMAMFPQWLNSVSEI